MLTKKYVNDTCKVEFSLPIEAVAKPAPVYLVGDFNDWDERSTVMRKKGDKYSVTLELPLNQEFQFRYLVNGGDWQNDWQADAYIPNGFGGENSVVRT